MGVAPRSCDPETRRKKQHVMSVSVQANKWILFILLLVRFCRQIEAYENMLISICVILCMLSMLNIKKIPGFQYLDF